jgi:putative transcriptional regulator
MANHITKLRKKAGIKTAKKAAKMLGISRCMMYYMEADSSKKYSRKPSSALGEKMARLFKCSLDDIFLPYFVTRGNNKNTESKNGR